MRLSCSQENLDKNLNIVAKAVATKTTLPIATTILLSAEADGLKLSATNLEMTIHCAAEAQVEEEGAVAIPARLLTEFVHYLPPGKIEMELAPLTLTLSLRSGRYNARMKGMDAGDFPPVPTPPEVPTATIEPGLFTEAIRQVIFAAAADDTRPVLTGVYTKLDGSELVMAAADGFRLAVHKTSLATPVAENIEIIIPSKSLAELSHIAAEEEKPIEMTVTPSRGQVLFHLNRVDFASQLIQGTFPNFDQLIPQSFTSRAVINTEDFLKSVRMSAIFARDSNGIVRVQTSAGDEFSPGKMIIAARSDEMGENVGEIDTLVEGESAKIAFNGKYLTDVLGVLKSRQVSLETTSPASPGVLKPLPESNYIHVIMPMFVQW